MSISGIYSLDKETVSVNEFCVIKYSADKTEDQIIIKELWFQNI